MIGQESAKEAGAFSGAIYDLLVTLSRGGGGGTGNLAFTFLRGGGGGGDSVDRPDEFETVDVIFLLNRRQ